jgi:putative FmdB family regulatory protein
MPIYEYRCDGCGHELEAMQKFSDAPLADCPACGKPALKKLVSAAGFQLKGSGWYATDFRNSGARPTGGSAGGKGKADDTAKPDAGGSSASATEPKKEAAAA